MTGFDKAVTRRTIHSYRIAIGGAFIDPQGRRLCVELAGDKEGDWIRIREHGRRKTVDFDVAELYRRGLIAKTAQDRKGRLTKDARKRIGRQVRQD